MAFYFKRNVKLTLWKLRVAEIMLTSKAVFFNVENESETKKLSRRDTFPKVG